MISSWFILFEIRLDIVIGCSVCFNANFGSFKKKKNANFGFVRVVLAILFVSLSTIVLLVCKLNWLRSEERRVGKEC